MYLLAFESSCDDTSVALLRDDELISMHTHTQLEHIETLGVVPEIAARLHADYIFDLITKVLTEGNIQLRDIDVFAATSEPGLIPSLLIGKTVAKTLATSHKKPLIWVNHIEGHIFSILLERKLEDIRFPMVVLSASGGHNDLFLWNKAPLSRGVSRNETGGFNFTIEKLGSTIDDSAWETMDKVGRMLWLPFPAGSHIDALAQKYNPDIHTNIPAFPIVLAKDTLDFSFSGLKSAAIREIEARKTSLNLSKGETSEITEYKEPGWLTANKSLYNYVKEYRYILKNNPSETEKILWEFLKTKKTNHKLRRQHVIWGFIADFVCLPLKTVIEIDGGIHEKQKEYDDMRTLFLRETGFDVIRFTNDEVLKNPEKVVQEIKEHLDGKTNTTKPLPRRGWGGLGGVGEVAAVEISYGYQRTIMTILSRRLIEAFEKYCIKSPAYGGVGEASGSIGLVGGVSANSALQKIMEDYSKKNGIPYYTPKSLKYCGDNAAMIGIRAYWEARR